MTAAPFGCARCWPASADEAWSARQRLPLVAELVDDTHLGIAIRACDTCRQQFVSVFVEDVDWVDGDDPQYVTMLPLLPGEAAALAASPGAEVCARVEALDQTRRCLRMAYPKGGPKGISWSTGISTR